MTVVELPSPADSDGDDRNHLRAVDENIWSEQAMADLTAEQVVLGMMLGSPKSIEAATDVLTVADFYWPKHATIWTALLGLWASGQPTDPTPVAYALAESNDLVRVGGAAYLHTLLSKVPTAAGTVGYHAKVVRDWARRRRVTESGLQILQSAKNLQVPVDEVIEKAQRTIHEATTVNARRTDLVQVGEFIDDEISYLEDVEAGKVEPGIPSGFKDLDTILGGWHPGRLIIPAGRPGAGKSLLTLNWVRKAITLGYPAFVFPMEMSKREVLRRLLSDWTRIPLHLFQKAQFSPEEWDRLRAAAAEIRKLPLVIDDQANTVAQIRANSRRAAQRYGRPGLIVADYIQRFNFAGKDRRDIEVGDAAKALKELARELETTTVGVCQINRGNEARVNKIPQLSDLRDSGQLEQEADQVILIHRDDYYDKESARAGEADLIVAKNRHGPTDTVTVAAQLHVARFVDMAIA
jgi:replicative DNA helicase